MSNSLLHHGVTKIYDDLTESCCSRCHSRRKRREIWIKEDVGDKFCGAEMEKKVQDGKRPWRCRVERLKCILL